MDNITNHIDKTNSTRMRLESISRLIMITAILY